MRKLVRDQKKLFPFSFSYQKKKKNFSCFSRWLVAMAGTMVRMMPMSHRIFKWESQEIDFSGDPAAINISDTVFGFLEEESEGSLASNNSDNGYGEIINEEAEEEEEEKENSENSEEDKNFWEKQNQLLHVSFNLSFLMKSQSQLKEFH